MGSLRRLVGLSSSDAASIERSEGTVPIEELALTSWHDDLTALHAFPNLRRLQATYGRPARTIARLLAHSGPARLESFTIDGYHRDPPPGAAVVVGQRHGWDFGGTARFTRAPDGTLSHLVFDMWGNDGDHVEALARLFEGFRERGDGLERVVARSAQPLAEVDRDRLGRLARAAGAELAFEVTTASPPP
jgi:hypothetical protein